MTDTDFGFRPDEAINEREENRKQNARQAARMVEKARQAEQDADPSAMSPEDRAIFRYLQAAVMLLESEYDIKLDDTSRP